MESVFASTFSKKSSSQRSKQSKLCSFGLSSGLEIRSTEHAGSGVFSRKVFDPGDLIWEELPVVKTHEVLTYDELKLCQKRSGIFKNQIVYLHTFVNCSREVQNNLLQRGIPDKQICEKSYLWQHIDSATKSAAEMLYSGYSIETLQNICLIFMTNQYHSSNDTGLIFEFGSYFNHHCAPNATYVYDTKSGKGRWHAMRPIFPDDEICVSYIYPHYPTFWRQDQLRHRYLFDCQCNKCAIEFDVNRKLPCTVCHPRMSKRGFDLKYALSIKKGFFVKSHESCGDLDFWMCTSCGTERIGGGIPLLTEKQLCVNVQMMMKKWLKFDLAVLQDLRELTLRLLGPQHFCSVYALQCLCRAEIYAGVATFEQLIPNTMSIVDWVEDKEPGFSGIHLKALLLDVVRWCIQSETTMRFEASASCLKFIQLLKPWALLFRNEDDIEELGTLEVLSFNLRHQAM